MNYLQNSLVTRKGELFEKYRGFPIRKLKNIVWEVLKESRGCSIQEAKDIKTLKPSEVEKIEEQLA